MKHLKLIAAAALLATTAACADTSSGYSRPYYGTASSYSSGYQPTYSSGYGHSYGYGPNYSYGYQPTYYRQQPQQDWQQRGWWQ